MKEIKISQGFVTFVDDDDYALASSYKWSIDKRRKTNYAKGWDNVNKKGIYLHRLILGATGRHALVDHKDGNGLNNTKDNLRISNHSLNQANRGKSSLNKTGYKGVHKRADCDRFQSYIIVNRKGIYLGLFKTAQEAHNAYVVAAEKFFGKEHAKAA